MKKQNMVFLTIIGFYCLFSIIIAVLLAKETINWIIIILEIIILLGFIIFCAVIYILNYKKILKFYNKKDNQIVIKRGTKFIKYYPDNMLKQYVYFMIAISYFNIYKDDLFITYVNKLSDKRIIELKYFWLSIIAIIKYDKESAMSNYYKFLNYKNAKIKSKNFTTIDLKEILEILLNCDLKEKMHLIKNKVNNERIIAYIETRTNMDS